MKKLFLPLLLVFTAVTCAANEEFVFHMGCHTPLEAATYATVMALTGNSGINVNTETIICDKRFILHAGYHNHIATAAYLAAMNATGDTGINVKMKADDANKCFIIAGILILATCYFA